jgi:hypothetical protein
MWQPVGCDFSGFFVELLGYLVPLSRRSSVRFAVDLGACSDETLQQLLPDEAVALRLASSRFRELPHMHDILVEHSEPCTWQNPGGVAVRCPNAAARSLARSLALLLRASLPCSGARTQARALLMVDERDPVESAAGPRGGFPFLSHRDARPAR